MVFLEYSLFPSFADLHKEATAEYRPTEPRNTLSENQSAMVDTLSYENQPVSRPAEVFVHNLSAELRQTTKDPERVLIGDISLAIKNTLKKYSQISE